MTGFEDGTLSPNFKAQFDQIIPCMYVSDSLGFDIQIVNKHLATPAQTPLKDSYQVIADYLKLQHIHPSKWSLGRQKNPILDDINHSNVVNPTQKVLVLVIMD